MRLHHMHSNLAVDPGVVAEDDHLDATLVVFQFVQTLNIIGGPDTVVDAYWSVILVDATDYRVVPNDLKHYNFNNHSSLAKEADGSLKISIGAQPVAGMPESKPLRSVLRSFSDHR